MTASDPIVLNPVRQTSAVVFASPHSGRVYPQSMLRCTGLSMAQIRSSEDAYVDDLIQGAVHHGAPVLLAQIARACLDLNRDRTELDPALIHGVARGPLNPRVASGLGVIPRVVAQARAIYQGKLPLDEAQRRIHLYWHPYHATLDALMAQTARQFGHAILIDMHSMPRDSLRAASPRPEIVLGDRFGASAAPGITDAVETAFRRAGFRTARNSPFAGAHIARSYGVPSKGWHAVQIEIDRTLYLGPDETPERGRWLDPFVRRIAPVLEDIAAIGCQPAHLAAE